MTKAKRIHVRKKNDKPKSLLRKFIEVAWEQSQRRKALNILAKQEWSVDFLTYLLVKASRIQQKELELVVTNKDGATLRIISSKVSEAVRSLDPTDDILNHLDEPDVVEAYIRRNGR